MAQLVQAAQVEKEGMFAITPSNFGKIPDSWILNFFTSRSALTMHDVGVLKSFDATSVMALFLFEINSTAQCKLPPACRSQEVLSKACTQRAIEAGARLQGRKFEPPVFSATGKIPRVRGSCCQPQSHALEAQIEQ